MERVRKWVFGDYTVGGKQSRKLPVSAAIGVAAWLEGETMAQMFARADADMYAEKKAAQRLPTPA